MRHDQTYFSSSRIYASRSDCFGSAGFGNGLAATGTGLMADRAGGGAGAAWTGCGDIATVARARAGCHGSWTCGALGGGVGDRTISACDRWYGSCAAWSTGWVNVMGAIPTFILSNDGSDRGLNVQLTISILWPESLKTIEISRPHPC